MRNALLSVSLFLLAATPACKSCCAEGCTPPQDVVEAVAKENPDCTRLTVHCTPAGAAGPIACASTSAEKKGKPSDPEDVKAMQTGETIVLDEAGAIDVTVPILAKDGKFTAVCGVTLKAAGLTKDQAKAKATTIAKAVEAKLGSCCGECCK
jgi:hypothetical protein